MNLACSAGVSEPEDALERAVLASHDDVVGRENDLAAGGVPAEDDPLHLVVEGEHAPLAGAVGEADFQTHGPDSTGRCAPRAIRRAPGRGGARGGPGADPAARTRPTPCPTDHRFADRRGQTLRETAIGS